jgi:glycine cleavage system H protein
LNVPKDLKYTKSHEWVRIEGETATVGITDYAQSELGDIVYVDLPSPGRALTPGESFGTIESVKTVSDIYSPVKGQIAETNSALEGASELINQDPYGQGWIAKITLDEIPNDLMDPEAYEALLSE